MLNIPVMGISQFKGNMHLDSALQANSEKWKVKANRKMFGLASPAFGPYETVRSEKLDSPVIRKQIKET